MALRDFRTIIEHVRVTPPTCIAVAVPQLEIDSGPQDDESFGTTFRLGCPCGCRETALLCFPDRIRGESVILSPLSLECLKCGRVTEFFDSDRHGYDPEVCGDSATMRGSGKPQRYRCGACGQDIGQAIVTFSFNGAAEILTDLPQALLGREQDVFDWFALEWQCAACHSIHAVTDYERA